MNLTDESRAERVCPKCGRRVTGYRCPYCRITLGVDLPPDAADDDNASPSIPTRSIAASPVTFLLLGLLQIPIALSAILLQETAFLILVFYTVGWALCFVTFTGIQSKSFLARVFIGVVAAIGMTIISAAAFFGACAPIFL